MRVSRPESLEIRAAEGIEANGRRPVDEEKCQRQSHLTATAALERASQCGLQKSYRGLLLLVIPFYIRVTFNGPALPGTGT